MHIHILGICGKFMSGLALIAKQMGFTVTGSDANITSPITTSLEKLDIKVTQGYEITALDPQADHVVIGNALSRGIPVVEHILDRNIPYSSGPQWLAQHVLAHRWVLAVAGTHGKTTTTSMLAWILEYAGFNPGFLIGGNPKNFSCSARYTDSNFFVIEADEYDTAFFDKRSKFLHYSPRTLIINNLEFDHADIFKDLDAIKIQFKHLLRILPRSGLIIAPKKDEDVQSLFVKECWTPIDNFGDESANWHAEKITNDATSFAVFRQQQKVGAVEWSMSGNHNLLNALAAIAAAQHVGILPATAVAALNKFSGVARRLELKGVINEISIYDDFAHHPTAIAVTISALRQRVGGQRIFAVVEFGSNTMKAGFHLDTLAKSFIEADVVILLRPKQQEWIENLPDQIKKPAKLFDDVEQIIGYLTAHCSKGDNVLVMSNMNFDGIHQKLLTALNV